MDGIHGCVNERYAIYKGHLENQNQHLCMLCIGRWHRRERICILHVFKIMYEILMFESEAYLPNMLYVLKKTMMFKGSD